MQIVPRKALKMDTNLFYLSLRLKTCSETSLQSNGPRPRIEDKLQRTKNVEKQAKTSFGSIGMLRKENLRTSSNFTDNVQVI